MPAASDDNCENDSGLETAKLLLDIGAVNFRPDEPYTLTAGWASPVYIDCRRLISFAEARRRIEACHLPYHLELRNLIGATRERFGGCLLIDCHSMPSASGPMNLRPETRVDVVLGDAHGSTCARAVSELAEGTLIELGFSVIRNKPYAGGYTTRHYGRPEEGVHVLQIEINRALYMDENRIQRGPGLPALVRRIDRLIKALTAIDTTILAPSPADGLKAAE